MKTSWRIHARHIVSFHWSELKWFPNSLTLSRRRRSLKPLFIRAFFSPARLHLRQTFFYTRQSSYFAITTSFPPFSINRLCLGDHLGRHIEFRRRIFADEFDERLRKLTSSLKVVYHSDCLNLCRLKMAIIESCEERIMFGIYLRLLRLMFFLSVYCQQLVVMNQTLWIKFSYLSDDVLWWRC